MNVMKALLFLVLVPGLALAAAGEARGREGASGEGGEETAGGEKEEGPLVPELPPERLPERTRPPPDPEREQYRRPPVYVRVTERVVPRSGAEYVPEVPVVENYLAEYFRRAGHPVASDPAQAAWRLEGDLYAEFFKELQFKGQTIAWKYYGASKVTVRDGRGAVLEVSEIPELYRESAGGEVSCVLDLRRLLAKKHYENLFSRGKVFANRDVVALLAGLEADPGGAQRPLSGGEVVRRLADIGLPAVHYLLAALTDTDTVPAPGEYPDLVNLEDLKVYHVADKALEEIFQKVSRMDLRTTDEQRFVIIRGWENEWSRFCPAFRDSPSRKRTVPRPGGERPRSEGPGPDERPEAPDSEAPDDGGKDRG